MRAQLLTMFSTVKGIANMESKPWYLSKTIWGLIVAALAMLLSWRFGVKIGDEGMVTDTLIDAASKVAETVGVLVAAYGRIKANTTITVRKAA
jgi:hypothetical protein